MKIYTTPLFEYSCAAASAGPKGAVILTLLLYILYRKQSLLGVPVELHSVINVPGEVLKLRIQFQ